MGVGKGEVSVGEWGLALALGGEGGGVRRCRGISLR